MITLRHDRYLIDSGCTTLDVFVEPDTDFDGTFTAIDADTSEPLRINGWMIESMERI